MDRKLTVSFNADRSVEYLFQRSDKPLASYTVEHPAEQVLILRADEGYESSITQEGWLRLTWTKNLTVGWSGVHYKSLQKLTPIRRDGRDRFRFNEDIRVECQLSFGLWLGSPSGPFSVVGACSTAEFLSDEGQTTQFEPRELTEEVFNASGILQVRWVLEPLGPEA